MPQPSIVRLGFGAGALLAERYQITVPLGDGPTGSVYRARDLLLEGTEVAIKIFHEHLLRTDEARQALRGQILQMRQLSHPNVVRVFDFEELDDGTALIAAELIDGWSLRSIIEARRGRPFSFSNAHLLLFRIAQGLAHAHERGVTHGNLKPDNVLISKSGTVKLSDFAIAGCLNPAHDLTRTGDTALSPRYMAPEQFAGADPSPQSDVYAWAVLAYEIVSGVPPFLQTSFFELAKTHSTQCFPSLLADAPAESWLDELLKDASAKAPAARPQSAGVLVERLRRDVALTKDGLDDLLESQRRDLAAPWRIWLSAWALFIAVALGLGLMQKNTRYLLAPYLLRLEQAVGPPFDTLRRWSGMKHSLKEPVAAVFVAVERGSKDVEVLIRANVSLDVKDEFGETALHRSVRMNNDTLRPLVAAGANINAPDLAGNTPLHLAVSLKSVVPLGQLIAAGASPWVLNNDGLAPIHLAVRTGHRGSIARLLHVPASVDARARDGGTALQHVIRSFSSVDSLVEIQSQLIASGADINARDNLGKTALHYAVEYGVPRAVWLLLKHGADTTSCDSSGRSPLSYAAGRPHLQQTLLSERRSSAMGICDA